MRKPRFRTPTVLGYKKIKIFNENKYFQFKVQKIHSIASFTVTNYHKKGYLIHTNTPIRIEHATNIAKTNNLTTVQSMYKTPHSFISIYWIKNGVGMGFPYKTWKSFLFVNLWKLIVHAFWIKTSINFVRHASLPANFVAVFF